MRGRDRLRAPREHHLGLVARERDERHAAVAQGSRRERQPRHAYPSGHQREQILRAGPALHDAGREPGPQITRNKICVSFP